MAFPDNPILKKSFSTFSGDWTYEIYDEDDDPGSGNHKELKIVKSQGLNQISGSSKFEVKKYIHPTQEFFSVLDENDYLYNKLKNQSSSRFRLDISLDTVLVNRFNILTEKIDSLISSFDEYLPLICFDGATNLKAHDFQLTEYYTIFDLFQHLINKIGHAIPINYMFDLKHVNADGTYLPDLFRIPVDYILPTEKNRTYYKILDHLLSTLELNLFQSNGAWWLQQYNIKDDVCKVYSKGLPPGLEVKTESKFNPIINLNDEISKNSKQTSIPISSPIIHTVNVKPDDKGGTKNPLFDLWNGPVTSPLSWDIISGSVSRVDINDGLRIDQNATNIVLKQVQQRLYNGGATLLLNIEFTIYDDLDEFENFDVEFAKIKLVDINGGSDYYITDAGAGYVAQIVDARLNYTVGVAPGVNEYDISIVDEVAIPLGFIGYIEVTIDCGDHTFDPDNDSSYEFTRIDFDQFEVKFKNQNSEYDIVFTHNKSFKKNEIQYSPTIDDTQFSNFNNAIQFLYDDAENIWIPSYKWNNDDSLVLRKSRLLLSNLSKPSNGLNLNLDRNMIQLDLRNSLLYNGIHYNPFYIAWDKINNDLQVHLIELNNDITEPDEATQIIEK